MQRVLPELGVPKENIVFISGIGCSSRFPYYMNTYGIHSIHGRAPTLATGLAVANPELSVWVITGDGDGLSIGGNHLIHACRRNVNLNIILFNNRIYGLTKGQFSPTSRLGHKSKSSPEATFVARTVDNQVKHLAETLVRAAAHKGTSFVEVYQNCLIFNPDEWTGISNRKTRDDNLLYLEHDEPMIFGRDGDQGLRMGKAFEPEVVKINRPADREQILVHDAHSDSVHLAYWLSRVEHPIPLGVFREVSRPTYTERLMGQVELARKAKGSGDLNALYRAGDVWEVTGSNGGG
jgi:2-oxoglutarate ferredoxin oxidoreductase subunit beta